MAALTTRSRTAALRASVRAVGRYGTQEVNQSSQLRASGSPAAPRRPEHGRRIRGVEPGPLRRRRAAVGVDLDDVCGERVEARLQRVDQAAEAELRVLG